MSGDIDVGLPATDSGRDGYRVRATTGAGVRRVDVPTDPAGTHRVAVSTGSGDVVVAAG